LFNTGPKWELVEVRRTTTCTVVRARHIKNGREVELLRGPRYAPRQDELKRCLEMELENLLDPLLAEYRRRRLDEVPSGYRF